MAAVRMRGRPFASHSEWKCICSIALKATGPKLHCDSSVGVPVLQAPRNKSSRCSLSCLASRLTSTNTTSGRPGLQPVAPDVELQHPVLHSLLMCRDHNEFCATTPKPFTGAPVVDDAGQAHVHGERQRQQRRHQPPWLPAPLRVESAQLARHPQAQVAQPCSAPGRVACGKHKP